MRKILMIEKGKRFGKWTVIDTLPRRKNKQTYWLCKCDCGCVLEVKSNSLMNGKSTQCSNCAKKLIGLKNRKGFGEISGDMWAQIKRNAIKKKIVFDIRIEEAWNLFILQNKKCALSGMDLKFSAYPYDPANTTATLDLINPEFGYVINNIQWIHKEISISKKSMSNTQYIRLCSLVSNYCIHNGKK